MPVLNDSCYTGPLRSEDLDRQQNPGNVYPHLHRAAVCPPCRMDHRCNQGRCAQESCAVEGGIHADPVPSGVLSMRRHRTTRNRIALALLLGAVGLIARLIWPVVGG